MTFFPKGNFIFMIACKCTSTSVNSPTYRSLLLIGYLFDLENKFLCGVLRDCDIPIALITTVSQQNASLACQVTRVQIQTATKKSLLHLAAILEPGLSQACERNCPQYLSPQMLQPRRVCIRNEFSQFGGENWCISLEGSQGKYRKIERNDVYLIWYIFQSHVFHVNFKHQFLTH